jgi:acetyl esterase/lipase
MKLKMTAVDTVLRFFVKYPLMGLNLYSSYAQLYWQRNVLSYIARIVSVMAPSSELDVSDVLIGGVPVRVYNPPEATRLNDGAIIFVHGGGFVLGGVDMYETVTHALASQSRMTLLSIEYRLAPEHVFPAGLNDVESVVATFLESTHVQYGVDPTKVVIMGDSAGGNLATVTARRMKAYRALPKLKGQVLLYPLVQYIDLQLPSYDSFAEYADTSFADPSSIARTLLFYAGVHADDKKVQGLLGNAHSTSHMLRAIEQHRLPLEFNATVPLHVTKMDHHVNHDLHAEVGMFVGNPDVSPLVSDDLHDLPRTLLATTDYDILRDEGYLYAQRLRDSGVPVDYVHYEGGFHAMINLQEELPLAQQMIREVVAWVHGLIE